MSGESKRRNKKQLRLEELPPEMREKVEEAMQETINNVIMIIKKAKIAPRIEKQEKPREALEEILEDMLHLDPKELGEYMKDKEFIGEMISTLYYIKKIAASRPTNIDSKLILMYFRTIDAVAASLARMIKNAKEIILERTIQIKQAAIMRENPIKELDRLESILTLLEGLRKHIKHIVEEIDI